MAERKPVLGDTKRPPKNPLTERWLREWEARSDNAPETHTPTPTPKPRKNDNIEDEDAG